MPSGGSRCRLAGSVPEEERCTVERADASLSYSRFLQRYGRGSRGGGGSGGGGQGRGAAPGAPGGG